MKENKPLESLSKEELLGLIKNTLPNTLISNHPCICVCCGIGFTEGLENAYSYMCDKCSLRSEP